MPDLRRTMVFVSDLDDRGRAAAGHRGRHAAAADANHQPEDLHPESERTMNDTHDDDRGLMERTVEEIAAAVATVISRAWTVSADATVLAMARATTALAVRRVQERPDRRDSVLEQMKAIPAAVESLTAVTH